MMTGQNNRILIVDDNPSIHEDFEKVLVELQDDDALQDTLDTDTAAPPAKARVAFSLEHAHSGEEALEIVERFENDGKPFALIFMDVRMPPGWNGIETIKRIWAKYPHIEMVICTAFSDCSWAEIVQELEPTDQLQFIRKPFDVVTIEQMALALTRKWNLTAASRRSLRELQDEADTLTSELIESRRNIEDTVAEVQRLQNILPVCGLCHKVSSLEEYYKKLDVYLEEKEPADVKDMVCRGCYEKMLARQA